MKRILVIDDDLEVLRYVAELLRQRNYAPITAGDGRSGLEIARRERPDLIVCDVTMPEFDGHDVLRALRAEPALALIPFIFLTAKAGREDLRAGMNLGADDYLTKPVDNDELVRTIETRLNRAAQLEQAGRKFQPDFSSADPLTRLGLTPRTAVTLLWVAQGKSNADIATILGITESTVKKHVQEIFERLGVETRAAAIVRALEALNLPAPGRQP